MSASAPNLLFITTDQQRSDALGVARQYDGAPEHPVLRTPALDWIATSGTRFEGAYAEAPVCIPARRTMMTGLTPASHGVPGFKDVPLRFPTLAGRLRDAGYQTALCGKLHLWPHRCRYGFEEFHWQDGPGASPEEADGDYLRHLAGLGLLGDQSAHGIAGESSVVRTWHLDERHHVANWTADRAVDFLGRRDPTRPFFLNVNFFHPHPPITPPSFYADRYLRLAQDRPEVFTRRTTASWSDDPGAQRRGYRWNATRAVPDDDAMLELRAFYWAQINHVDDQIQRVLTAIDRSVGFGNTMVVFTSDHGEMLGDHGFMRKRLPYEPSARVPMLVKPPEDWGIAGGEVRDELVGLRDVMPTLLDAAGVETRSVDGRSLLPLCRGEAEDWRTQLHGECSATQAFDTPTGMQYLVADLADGHRWKLCHFPGHGRQQLFNLTNDPQERHDVSGDPDHAVVRDELVGRMVAQLADRPEDFVVGGQLAQVDGNTTDVLPGCA